MAKKKGKDKPTTRGYYEKAIRILKKDGYIEKTKLLEIFKGMNCYTILNYFDRQEEPVYKDVIRKQAYYKGRKKGMRTFVVYKLLNPVFEEWREERKIVGAYNNSYQGSMGGYFK